MVFYSAVNFLPWEFLLIKKLEIEKTKTTFKTDITKVALIFSISNVFVKKSSLANKWMSFSYSNSALPTSICQRS